METETETVRNVVAFRLESELIQILSKRGRLKLLGPRLAPHSMAFAHFQIGMTIPDLLFVAGRKGVAPPIPRRIQLTAFDAWVVTALKRSGPLREEEIADELHSHPHRVGSALRRLRRYGLVKADNLSYELNARRLLLSAEIVAVEAKLLRWTDAINQALSYLNFANRAYVALPKHSIVASRRVTHACKESGVGLISVGPYRTEILVRPKRRDPMSPERVWLIWKTLGIRK